MFNRIAQKWGMPVIDLFASRDNNQVERFLTWRPDPLAVGTDAMQWNWDKEHLVYAFPHVSMIWKVLQKLKKHRRTTMILIAPAWITRHWYPILLSLLIERPILLGKNPDLLLDQQLQRHDLQVLGHLNLVAWKVSSDPARNKGFLSQCPISWQRDGQTPPSRPTMEPGKHGLAGVSQDRLFQYQQL